MENILMILCWIAGPFVLFGLFCLLAGAFSHRMKIVRYAEQSGKVKIPFRLVVIADLHSCFYGAGQSELAAAIEREAPCAVLLVGDIEEAGRKNRAVETLLAALGGRYPCFYVTGNHEERSGKAGQIREMMAGHGVTTLSGTGRRLKYKGQLLWICGVDDPTRGGEEAFARQLAAAAVAKSGEGLSILLSHRPERVGEFEQYDFDYIFCGHAHGGQVRIPGLLNGLYAPHQGIFPRYAGGRYPLRHSVMIVSRGLAQRPWPRIFNRPELVVVDFCPKK